MKTTQQKLNEKLGISDGQSIDDFLDDISLDTEKMSNAFQQLSGEMQHELSTVDGKLESVKSGALAPTQLVMSDLAASMKEVEDLVVLSKQMYKHIYENFCSSDLLDSELIGAAAKLLESIHINVKEFIDMYRDRQRSIERLQAQQTKFEQAVYMENLRHQHAMERMKAKADEDAVDVENGMRAFSLDDITKILAEKERQEAEELEVEEIEPQSSSSSSTTAAEP